MQSCKNGVKDTVTLFAKFAANLGDFGGLGTMMRSSGIVIDEDDDANDDDDDNELEDEILGIYRTF